MKVYLVRHGESTANVKKLYCGITDVFLTESGKKELENLKGRMSQLPYDVCYSSPLVRCKETAQILFGITGEDLMTNDGLMEIDFGDFENKSHDMLLGNSYYQKWLDHWPHSHIPNGEQFKEFEVRVMNTFNQIIKSNQEKNILLVCHGGVIMMILSQLFKEKALHQWKTPNGSGYEIEYTNNKWTYKEL